MSNAQELLPSFPPASPSAVSLEKRLSTETLQVRTRFMAALIRDIPKGILEAFRQDDPTRRLRRLQDVGNMLGHCMCPVICWAERRLPWDASRTLIHRMWLVLERAVDCAAFEIPEFKGGTYTALPSISPGMFRVRELEEMASLFATSLEGLAGDIAREDAGHPVGSLPVGRPAPNWICERFRQQQRALLLALWGREEVSSDELIGKLEYSRHENAAESLRRRVDETNTGLSEKAKEIGEQWEIRKRDRDGTRFYLLARVQD